MNIGKKIKKLRKAMRLSQKELGEMIGSYGSSVCHWEKGMVEPSLISAICLADIFNVSLDELCCRNFKGGN